MVINLEIDIKNENEFLLYNLIDLRSHEKYLNDHIKGSINIPYNYLLIEPWKYLNQRDKYLLICSHGLMSREVSRILNNNGYYTYSLRSGMIGYRNFDKNFKKNKKI